MAIFNKFFKKPDVVILEQDPDVLVKQIHNEVDSLEQDCIAAIEKMLSELSIPTTSKIQNKADLMRSLGFSSNNEIVKQSEAIESDIKTKEQIKQANEKILKLISYYKQNYPLDKIIPFVEFNKVLEKYNLVYAPSKNYIKDVPEKNLLEISNAKPVNYNHTESDFIRIDPKNITFYANHTKDYKDKILSLLKSNNTIYPDDFQGSEGDFQKLVEINCPEFLNANLRGQSYYFNKAVGYRENRKGLFIAAPLSHFNTDDLNSNGKGFFETKKVELKDPIAFFILKHDIVRIVSKWGTSDDQSFMDPIVQNENLN